MNPAFLAEIEPPIILIVFVVIGAIKWLLEKIKGQGEQPHETSESLEDIYEEFREEIRQHQTAAQQPAQSPPPLPHSSPPVVQHAQHAQHQPQPQQVSLPKKTKQRTLTAEEKAAAARFQQLSTGTRKRQNSPQASVRDMLSNPQSTRQAIILTEILGKPKSMQDA